ncbi:MFS transporter [Mangrovicoccus algicola]|uniref:MFS transporter n=1 Tax=Mangrovicoccus algicola TaxID=2771008 RepID=A0A8J6Z5R4_9RHOB|nr:MFS transporter [Mangrovicoccus algicola]MBE3636845.1 MFS transporter [Mangrovicoccus algicola]
MAGTPQSPAAREAQQGAAPQRPGFVPKRPLVALGYMLAAVFIALSQSLGQGFLTANIRQLAGELGATVSDTSWLMVAFIAPRASLPLMLIKIRTQYGLRRFAEVSIAIYVAVALLSLWTADLHSAMVVELLSGISAAPLSTLAFLYMLEPFPPAKKLQIGLPLALTFISLGTPLARAISPLLLQDGSWFNILMLKLGMAMICLFLVFRLPLAATERMKVIRGMDLLSFALIAGAFGGLVACFTTGYTYWWTAAPWMGVVLAASLAGLVLALVIELQRGEPLLDVRWLMTPEMLHLTAALLVFRIILSEQAAGAPGLFQTLGYAPAQVAPLFWVISAATILGGAVCCLVLKPQRVPQIHMVALAMIALGAWMDAHSAPDVAPAQMMLSQAMIGFAAALFLPPAMAGGLVTALQRGPKYLLSFVILFLSTQILGGTIGSGLFRTFVAARITAHGEMMAGHMAAGDPLVAQQISALAAGYAAQIADPVQRQAEAVSALAQTVTRQATVAAYNDVFALTAALALGALAVLVLHVLRNLLRDRMAPAAPAAE